MPENKKSSDPQKDKMDRPQPNLDPAEGDEQTIEEDLKQKEQQQRRAGRG